MKKRLLFLLAISMIVPSMIEKVIATNKSGSTPITYDNRNYIPDPDHPNHPEWAVTIPSSIHFTDTHKQINTDIKLVSKNGGNLPINYVIVTVHSSNNYKLVDGSDELGYQLIYDGKIMVNNTNNNVAMLNHMHTSKTGIAVLGNDKAATRGKHIDTLVYTISH